MLAQGQSTVELAGQGGVESGAIVFGNPFCSNFQEDSSQKHSLEIGIDTDLDLDKLFLSRWGRTESAD